MSKRQFSAKKPKHQARFHKTRHAKMPGSFINLPHYIQFIAWVDVSSANIYFGTIYGARKLTLGTNVTGFSARCRRRPTSVKPQMSFGQGVSSNVIGRNSEFSIHLCQVFMPPRAWPNTSFVRSTWTQRGAGKSGNSVKSWDFGKSDSRCFKVSNVSLEGSGGICQEPSICKLYSYKTWSSRACVSLSAS